MSSIITKKNVVTTQKPQSWSIRRTLFQVNIRELNKELCTGLSILYTKT